MRRQFVATALAAASLIPAAVFSNDRPPAKGLGIARIVRLVEQAGYAPVIDASFDDGRWEVEAVKDGRQYELAVSTDGQITATHEDDRDERPASDAMPLSKLLANLGNHGWSPISEAGFERRTWEIEAYKSDVKHELRVDPNTGEVLRERRDD
jgi:hypothetical protein